MLQGAQDRFTLSITKRYEAVDGKALAQHGSEGQHGALVLRKQSRPRENCAADGERQFASSCSGIARKLALE